MNYFAALGFFAVLFCCILSAGCIGTTTSDIMFGDQKVGVLTLTPHDNLFSSNGSLADKVDMQVDIFGLTFSRSGVKMSEAMDISSLIKTGDLSALNDFSLISSDLGGTSGLDLSTLERFLKSQGGTHTSSGSLDTAGKNLEKMLNGIINSL